MIKSPLERMYQSFSLFTESIKNTGIKKTIPLSSGVNWIEANAVVKKSLKYEIEYNTSYRNYGRSTGGKIITDIISDIETTIIDTKLKPKTIITNGTSDGAWLILQSLVHSGFLTNNNLALIIGQSFPYYHTLAQSFNLQFSEIIDDINIYDGYLPNIEYIVNTIENKKPKILFLITPNNPLGEEFSLEDLVKINQVCIQNDTKIIIDRVCQMSWDSKKNINQVFMNSIHDNNAYIVDSFSKSDSLAGIRTGFLLTGKETETHIDYITKYKSLNPIVFSTYTLLLIQMASLKNDKAIHSYKKLLQKNKDYIFSEYPNLENNIYSVDCFIKEYKNEEKIKQNIFLNNFKLLKDTFTHYSINPIILDAGYNVALSLETMYVGEEYIDQLNLAKYGIGILTEDCFRVSRNERKNYFIRIGLAIPTDNFKKGLKILKDYYLSEKRRVYAN